VPKISPPSCDRVYYHPVEAAALWSDLEKHEHVILGSLNHEGRPSTECCKQWPILKINTARIFDGLLNGDLPYGRHGITSNDPKLLKSRELTVRHSDLRSWIIRFYPTERPHFLFDDLERQLHPTVTIESVQALLTDREVIRVQLVERCTAYDQLYREYEQLRKISRKSTTADMGSRAETTYLNIVGGLLSLLLGNSPAGKPYSSFKTLGAVIQALLAHYEGHAGIAERTLWAKLAAAKRQIEDRPR